MRAIDPTKRQPKDDVLLFRLKLKISYYFVSLYQTKLYEKITQKRKVILVIVYRSRNIACHLWSLIVCVGAWQATDSFRWLIKRRENKLSFESSFVFNLDFKGRGGVAIKPEDLSR